MIFSEQSGEISKALVASWGAIKTPKHNTNVTVKTRTGGTYEFSYTDLDGIFDAIRDVYKENKIAVLQNAHTTIEDGTTYVTVETMLLHESGEWVKSQPLKVAANTNIQDMGGQITYMKRYSLSAMLGLATEKDDDANGSVGNEVEYGDKGGNKLSQAQVNRAFAIAKSNGITPEQVKQAVMKDYKKTEVADLTKQQYDELCNRLENAKKGDESA